MVDDDMEDQQIIKDTFNDLGYGLSIHFESTGEQAIGYLQECRTAGHFPCLVVLDLNMPKMNGRQMLNYLKNDLNFRDIPVIIYSTSLNPLERDQCMALGAHSYVIKPITYTQSIDTAKMFYSFCNEASL